MMSIYYFCMYTLSLSQAIDTRLELPPDRLTYRAKGLTPSHKYSFRVSAATLVGDGDTTRTVTASTVDRGKCGQSWSQVHVLSLLIQETQSMRATILPETVILTKAHRAAAKGKGVYCGLSTASEVFLFFPTQCMFIPLQCNSFKILTRRKYCNRNTPNPQYSPLLTSGG